MRIDSATIGILLFISVIIIAFASIGLRFINKKISNNYFFWSIPALCIAIYFILFRFYDDWVAFFSNTKILTGSELNYRDSIIISKSFLLDLCPFLGLFLPLSLVFDKTRKTSYVMAPFAILGGIVSFGSILQGEAIGGNVEFTIQYLFIGHPENELYFFLHSYLIIIGFALVFQSNVNRVSYLWSYYLFAALYFVYVVLFVYVGGVTYNTTGVSINDWLHAGNTITHQSYDGEYALVSKAFGLDFPWIMIFAYSLGWLTIQIITTIQILCRNLTVKNVKANFKILGK